MTVELPQEEEQRRNSTLSEIILVHNSHPMAPSIYSLYDNYEHLEVRAAGLERME